MNGLVKIEKRYIPADGNESNTVNARELSMKLEVKRQFADWIKDQIVRARLVEGQDFITLHTKVNRQILKEYYLTLDAAKHIAMVSGCEKGHEIRQYFIDFEKFHSGQPQFYIPKTLAEALRLAADKEEEVQRVTHKIQEDAPKVDYVEKVVEQTKNLITLGQYGRILKDEQRTASV